MVGIGFVLIIIGATYIIGTYKLIRIMKRRDPEIIPPGTISVVLNNKTVHFNPLLNMDVCSICLSDYDISSLIIRLDCGHIFHRECIYKWIRKKRHCPYCRCQIS